MDRAVSIEREWVVNEVHHPRVKLISGNRFYALVTGAENALQELHDILPHVITEIMQREGELKTSDIAAVQQLQSLMYENNDIGKVYEYFFNSAFGNTRGLL